MPEPHAEAVVREQVHMIERNLATKADVEAVRADIETAKFDLIKWMIATNITAAALAMTRSVRILSAVIALTLGVVGPAAAQCRYTGSEACHINISPYNFTCQSWVREYSETDITSYRFLRRVCNNHDQELWVDWKGAGLKGFIKPRNEGSIHFSGPSNENTRAECELWYGRKPRKIRPTTVLRPDEARASDHCSHHQHLVQSVGGVPLAEAFTDRRVMRNLLGALATSGQPPVIILTAGGRIAVLTRQEPPAGRELSEPGDFVTVQVTLRERYSLLDDNVLENTLDLSIQADPQDFNAMQDADGRLPTIYLTANDDAGTLAERLLPHEPINLAEPAFSLDDRSPQRLSFPIRRRPVRVRVQFGDDDGLLVIPFGVAEADH